MNKKHIDSNESYTSGRAGGLKDEPLKADCLSAACGGG